MRTRESYKAKVGKVAAFAVAGMFAFGANATPSVTIDSVTQRWPWNNKVDITYTVTDGQDMEAGVFYRIDFTATIGSETYYIDGVTNVGASASTGRHTVTWKAPMGLKEKNCSMSASVSSHTAPSGDDYMVLDLDTGVVTFEGLLGTGTEGQSRSNSRYNVDAYKKDKMVFRKVPAGGTYYTGDTSGIANDPWTTDRDYYIGVFMVTQYQYCKIRDNVPSGNDRNSLKPVSNVSRSYFRGGRPNSSVTSSSTGTFMQRLVHLTGNKYRFDLPTVAMSEIAARAGTRTYFFWGGNDTAGLTALEEYAVCKENSGAALPVGSKKPNGWGLYDAAGNGNEICRDEAFSGSIKSKVTDVFTPYDAGGNGIVLRGGASGGDVKGANFRAGRIGVNASEWTDTSAVSWCGFRIAWVKD